MSIEALKRVGRVSGPRVLITGGVHGDEFEPMLALRKLDLELSRRSLCGQVTLIPVVNAGAFRLGQRTGEDNLDLARTCPGRPDGTATERIAHELTVNYIRNSDYYIDLHTGGLKLQVHPLCGYMLHPDPTVLDRQRRMAHAFGLPILWGTDPNLEGRTLSVARDTRVPAIYAEYLGGGCCDPRGVDAYVRGCLNVLVALGQLPGEPEPPPSPPLVIEDARPNSGYMQIQHPAPIGGFFECAVTLGQRVRRGDILGNVSDALGAKRAIITADRAGIVLVARTFASVEKGDGLAVILETDTDPPPSDSIARGASCTL